MLIRETSRDLCGIMTDVVSFKHHFYKLFSYKRYIYTDMWISNRENQLICFNMKRF